MALTGDAKPHTGCQFIKNCENYDMEFYPDFFKTVVSLNTRASHA